MSRIGKIIKTVKTEFKPNEICLDKLDTDSSFGYNIEFKYNNCTFSIGVTNDNRKVEDANYISIVIFYRRSVYYNRIIEVRNKELKKFFHDLKLEIDWIK